MTRALLLAPALLLAACGSPDAPDEPSPEDETVQSAPEADSPTGDIDLDLGDLAVTSELPGSLVDVVTTDDGRIELGVTDEVLFSRLSESLRDEIQSEMDDETADETGLGGTIARAVTGAVAEGLAASVSVPLDEVRDLRYENGRIEIDMVDGQPSPFENATSDDEPMLSQFSADAGRRLADAFDKATGR